MTPATTPLKKPWQGSAIKRAGPPDSSGQSPLTSTHFQGLQCVSRKSFFFCLVSPIGEFGRIVTVWKGLVKKPGQACEVFNIHSFHHLTVIVHYPILGIKIPKKILKNDSHAAGVELIDYNKHKNHRWSKINACCRCTVICDAVLILATRRRHTLLHSLCSGRGFSSIHPPRVTLSLNFFSSSSFLESDLVTVFGTPS